jgi:hypothetical protein
LIALRSALAAVQDEQDRLPGIQATVDQVGQQRAGQGRVLRRAFPQSERDLHPLGGDTQRDDMHPVGDLQPVEHHHRQAHVIKRRAINSSSAVRVFSMNISDTVLFRVALAVRSTGSPTGSPTRANFRVDTPASIRSITARCNG